MDNLSDILLAIFLTTLSTWYVKFLWSRRHLYLHAWNVPGPLAFPIVGSAYKALRSNAGLIEVFNEFYEYPGIIKVWFSTKLWYVVFEPKYLEKVFTSPDLLEKPHDYKRLTDIIGDTIFTPSVKKSKRYRRAVAPIFYKNAIDSYVKGFAESSADFAKVLRSLAGRKDLDVEMLCLRYTLDTTCKSIFGFGVPVSGSEAGEHDYGYCLRKVAEISTYRFVRIWFNVKLIYNMSRTKQEIDKWNNLIHAHILSMISTARRLQEIQTNSEDSKNGNSKYESDFFKSFIRGSEYTEEEIVDTIKSLFSAGVDTAASVLCSTLMMLALHPDAQQKVYEEVMEVVGHRQIEHTDLQHFRYTEMAIKESMRLFPPTIIFARDSTGAVNLGEYVLPKDGAVVIFPLVIHRNPTVWNDPLKFDPDRFLPDEMAQRSPYAFVPFSHGVRNCIGWQHAMWNLKTAIAGIIREVKVFTGYQSVEDIKLNCELVLTYTHGSKLWFEPRE
ncbi:unnamed protein product [Phyllotreta striolata]|uniref:Cytochrome P450 monooxygenase n=1 Tax=Phyllotreta striolata TaxID=444603 RepID=A0A9N9TZP9_PHYSR|nr:unnamed protein product [Phyllotreta striolata]